MHWSGVEEGVVAQEEKNRYVKISCAVSYEEKLSLLVRLGCVLLYIILYS